jgi:hypothetical protein
MSGYVYYHGYYQRLKISDSRLMLRDVRRSLFYRHHTLKMSTVALFVAWSESVQLSHIITILPESFQIY